MTFAQIKTRIQDLTDDVIQTAQLENWINDEYQELNGRVDWEYKNGSATATMTTANDYTLATSFSITDFGKALQLRDTTNNQQYSIGNWENKDQLLAEGGFSAVISPDDATISVYPPTDGGTLELMYGKKLSDLSSSSDSPTFDSQFHQIIVFGVSELFYYQQGRTGMATTMNSKKENLIRSMIDFYSRKSPSQEIRMKSITEGLAGDFKK